MASNNVAQFAAELKMPAGVLLEQLQAAGVQKASANDDLSETDKARLLDHLRKSHGSADADKRNLTDALKNLSIMGGLLLVVAVGAGPSSMDRR